MKATLKRTYSFDKHGWKHSCIMVCNQTAGTVKSFALMNQHVTSFVLKFICHHKTIWYAKKEPPQF